MNINAPGAIQISRLSGLLPLRMTRSHVKHAAARRPVEFCQLSFQEIQQGPYPGMTRAAVPVRVEAVPAAATKK